MSYTPKNPNGQDTMADSSPVVIASDQSAVPVTLSGGATAANQTTIIGHVDGIEGILTTMDADTGAISLGTGGTADAAATAGSTGSLNAKARLMTTQLDAIQTAVQTLDNAIAGSEMQVDVLTMPTVTVTATNLDVQSGGVDLATSTQASAIQTAVQLIDDTIFADDAAVTLGTSKGSIAAGVAVQTDGTDPSAVSAEADAAALRTDMQRILLVNMTHPRGTTVSADYASAQTNTSVIAAPGSGLSIYITDIMCSNGATAGNVTLLDGSGGSVKWEAYPAINGGAVLSGLRQPIRLTANTALCITSTTVTTHSIFIGYYVAP